MQMKLLGITNVDFDVTDQQQIRSSVSVRYWRNVGVYWYCHHWHDSPLRATGFLGFPENRIFSR
jgi:hypothetical protein